MKRPKIFHSRSEIDNLQKIVNEKLKETPLEKDDILAMTIAALVTILPVVLLILFIFFIVSALFVGGF
jgi:hypothetical protein